MAAEDYRDDEAYKQKQGRTRWQINREKKLRELGLWEQYKDEPLREPEAETAP